MDIDALKTQLTAHEGEKFYPYPDTVGKFTIGIGHNLTDRGISKAVSNLLFTEDAETVFHDLDMQFPWWRQMSESRQLVIADMCFNLGINRLKGFTDTLRAMQAGRYADAAAAMLDSVWAKQVGQRAKTLASMMENG